MIFKKTCAVFSICMGLFLIGVQSSAACTTGGNPCVGPDNCCSNKCNSGGLCDSGYVNIGHGCSNTPQCTGGNGGANSSCSVLCVGAAVGATCTTNLQCAYNSPETTGNCIGDICQASGAIACTGTSSPGTGGCGEVSVDLCGSGYYASATVGTSTFVCELKSVTSGRGPKKTTTTTCISSASACIVPAPAP